MLLAAIGTSVANATLTTFAQVFAASFQQVQWIVRAYLGITTLMAANSKDRHERRASALKEQ